MTIRLQSATRRGAPKTVYKDQADRILALSEIVWSDNRVDVLVCDSANSSPEIIKSYDLGALAPANELDSRAKLQQAVLKRYKLTELMLAEYGGDAVRWACANPSAATQFLTQLDSQMLLVPDALP